MAGFDADGARAAFVIPDGVRPLAVVAVGIARRLRRRPTRDRRARLAGRASGLPLRRGGASRSAGAVPCPSDGALGTGRLGTGLGQLLDVPLELVVERLGHHRRPAAAAAPGRSGLAPAHRTRVVATVIRLAESASSHCRSGKVRCGHLRPPDRPGRRTSSGSRDRSARSPVPWTPLRGSCVFEFMSVGLESC